MYTLTCIHIHFLQAQDQGTWENKLVGDKGDVYLLRRGDEKVALTKEGFAYMGGKICVCVCMYVCVYTRMYYVCIHARMCVLVSAWMW